VYLPHDTDNRVKVENHLYKVHEFFFLRDSEKIRSLLEEHSVVDAGTTGEGVPLRDIKSIDFERFLTILYPPYVMSRSALHVRMTNSFTVQ
jgi:hypothetical protein